ncbi:MAG: class I SAM-dependent DNA methyltransferase [Rhodothermales bacterium]
MPGPDQDKINNALWSACDTFRGTVDPAQYKDYILVFLFWKYLSDIHARHERELREKYGDNETLIRRKLERDRFVLPEGTSFYYVRDEHRNDAELGDKINKALQAIEDANKQKLEGVFRNIDFNSEPNLGETKARNRRMKSLFDDFSDPALNFSAFTDTSDTGMADVIGDGYMYLISRFASDSGKKGGEFYTPKEVSKLLALLLDPQPGERIYDPTIGSGSLAITVADELRHPDKELHPDKKSSNDFAIYGQENNRSTWALAKMNMFLHNVDGAQIEAGDTISDPKLKEADQLLKADIVVANPPFSLKKWGYGDVQKDPFKRFTKHGMPPKSKGDFAFLLHMIASMKEATGRVGVIVPHGVLFRGGAEGKIRRSLIEANLLQAVIGLPEGLFYGTGIPAAILIFRKGREHGDVLFIDASRDFDDRGTQNVLRRQDIKRIVETYQAYERDPDFEMVEKYAYKASRAEIEENDCNLNIPRYVDTFEPEEPVDLEAVAIMIRELEEKLGDTRRKLNGYLQELGLPT